MKIKLNNKKQYEFTPSDLKSIESLIKKVKADFSEKDAPFVIKFEGAKWLTCFGPRALDINQFERIIRAYSDLTYRKSLIDNKVAFIVMNANTQYRDIDFNEPLKLSLLFSERPKTNEPNYIPIDMNGGYPKYRIALTPYIDFYMTDK